MDISVAMGVVAPQARMKTTAFTRPSGLGLVEISSLSHGDAHPELKASAAAASEISDGLVSLCLIAAALDSFFLIEP